MEEYEQVVQLIQTSLIEPYRHLEDSAADERLKGMEDFRRRINILERMKKDITAIDSKVRKVKQNEQRNELQEYLERISRLVELQLQLNRMLCHRQNGCSLNMEEYERVSFEIDCLERLIAWKMEYRRASL